MPAKPRKHRRKRKATRELSSEQKRAKRARWRRNESKRGLASWRESGSLREIVLELERDSDGTRRRLAAISKLSERLLDSQGGERSRLTRDLRLLLRRVRPPLRAKAEADAEREQKKRLTREKY